MNCRYTWIIVCQLAAMVFCAVFIADVRGSYREAVLRQGGEIERHNIIKDFHEAGVVLPEGFRTSPDKHVIIGPRLIELGQNVWHLIPATVFQCFSIWLVIRARREEQASERDIDAEK